MKFTVSGKTDTGMKRKENEDSVFFDPDLPFALVADGMGGHQAGAVASRVGGQTVRDVLEGQLEKTGRLDKSVIIRSIRDANSQLLTLSKEEEELAGLGTTMSLVVLHKRNATIAHVGDSRVYLYRSGKLQQLTSDHSWVGEQIKANIISEEEARTDSRRHWILRALGQEEDVEVDVFTVDLRAGDLLLLCSDGLYGMVPDSEMGEITAVMGSEPEKLCDELVRIANMHGGEDNISVVVVRVDEVGGTGARPAVISGVVLVCLLVLLSAGLLKTLSRSEGDSPSSRPLLTVPDSGTAGEPAQIEIQPAGSEQEPVEEEMPIPEVSTPEVADAKPQPPKPSLVEMKRLAQDKSRDIPTRAGAYKQAAALCMIENDLTEAHELLQAAVELDAGISYSENDALPFELDDTKFASLSGVLADAKRVVYTGKRNASDIDGRLKAVADDGKGYVAAATEVFKKADGLAEAGQLPEALDTLDRAERQVERALAEYRKDKSAYAEAVESTQTQLASLDSLERWEVELLEPYLEAVASSEDEMRELSHRGEFQSAIDRASDIREKAADVVARAATNRKARESAADALDNAESLVSAIRSGLSGDYSARTKGQLERFERELNDARIMIAEGNFKEAQSTAGQIGEESKNLVDEMFEVLKEKRGLLLGGLPAGMSDGIEHRDLDGALAAADAVDYPPGEAVPELLKLLDVAAKALDSLDVDVKDAIEKDAAWRREASGYLAEAETYLASMKERFQKSGGSDQALKFWMDKCESGPVTGLCSVPDVPENFAQEAAELRALVRSQTEGWPSGLARGDLQQIEDRIKTLRQIAADGAVEQQ